MNYHRLLRPKYLILPALVALLIAAVACGGDDATPVPGATATPLPTSTPQPTATPVDVGAIASGLQEALKQTVEQALAQQAGDAQEPISQADLQALVQRAVEASVPEGTSPLEIRRMVEDAVKATAQEGLTREDVAGLVAEAVAGAAEDQLTAEEVQKIVVQAVATPTPLPVAAATLEWESPAFVKDGKYGGVLKMSSLLWRENWDPHQQTGLLDSAVSSGFFNQILRWDHTDRDKLVGDLAKSWTLNGDGSFTFKIYEGAKFLDGETVNADDVKFSLDRMVQEGRPRPKVSKIRPYYDSSEVIDDRTVKVNLKILGSPAFLQFLTFETMKVVPSHVAEQQGFDLSTDEGQAQLEEYWQDFDNINGSGPFKYRSAEVGVLAEWEKNPDYWKTGMPFLDGIQIFWIEDSNRVIAAYRAGQVLMPNFGDTGLGVRDILTASQEWGDSYRLHWIGSTNLDTLIVNFEAPPFDDPRVRRAFYIGVDRLAHINTLLVGRGTLGVPFFPNTWMSPTDEVIGTWPGFRYVDKHTGEDINVPYGNDDAVKNPIDLQKARALLAEAGFTEDNPLKITYNTFNIAYHSSVAQLMAQQFKAFGVETEIKPLDVPTNFAEITAGRYQIFHITRATDILDSDELLLGNYMPGGVPIWENINIPRINDIFDLSSRESDFDERQKLIQEAGEILRQGEGSMLGLAWIDRYALPVSPKVKNFRVGRLLGENYMHESIWLDDPSEYPNFD